MLTRGDPVYFYCSQRRRVRLYQFKNVKII